MRAKIALVVLLACAVASLALPREEFAVVATVLLLAGAGFALLCEDD
jgi:hypothetical protein